MPWKRHLTEETPALPPAPCWCKIVPAAADIGNTQFLVPWVSSEITILAILPQRNTVPFAGCAMLCQSPCIPTQGTCLGASPCSSVLFQQQKKIFQCAFFPIVASTSKILAGDWSSGILFLPGVCLAKKTGRAHPTQPKGLIPPTAYLCLAQCSH